MDVKFIIQFIDDDLVIEAVKGHEHFTETFYGAIKEVDCIGIYFNDFLDDYLDFLNKKVEVLYDV